MNQHITRVALAVLVLFGALFVNLNVITLLQADELANHPANRRVIIREYAIPRGPIVVDEQAIARSVETDGQYRYLRVYPEGDLYAHLTGYYSLVLQRSGLEAELNTELTGRPTEVVAQNLGDFLGGADRPGNAVELTVRSAVQEAARDALDGRVGAVVAVDPRTGAVLASYANPTFDPNPLSSHSPAEINEAWTPLRDRDDRPLTDRAIGELYAPGSTFKILVTAAALEQGINPSSEFPDEVVYDVPLTSADIGNFSGGDCAAGSDTITLHDAFRVSCNTVYARLGVELGAEALREQAERFGFNHTPPYELAVAASGLPAELDVPATAQSAIGERDVRATAMQMALVAATVANGGQLMRPHVVARVLDPDGQVVRGADVGRWTDPPGDGRPISPRTAQQLHAMMLEVVRAGTGTAAHIDGVDVGGKTGTAQGSGGVTAWFVGFADEQVAVAVVIPDAGDDATGGRLAAPVARAVMAAALESGS